MAILSKKKSYLKFYSPLFRNNVTKVLFVPYASTKPNSYDEYTEKVAGPLNSFGFEVENINKYDDPVKAVNNAQAIFIGKIHI